MTRRVRREVRRTRDPLDRKRRTAVAQRDARRDERTYHRDMRGAA